MGIIDDFKNIGDFFKDIGLTIYTALKIFPKIATLFVELMKLITKPAEFIMFFVKIFIFGVLCIFNLFWVACLRKILIFILLIISLILSLMCFVMSSIFTIIVSFWDCVIFRGWLYPSYYRYIGAAENDPSSWAYNGGFHKMNVSDKVFMMSAYRCDNNYFPDPSMGNILCKRKENDQPSHCSQANIYNLYNTNRTHGSLNQKTFLPGLNFVDQSDTVKREMIESQKKNNKMTNDSCDLYMNQTTPFSKQICKSADMALITPSSDMQKMCMNTFCTNGKWDSFCQRLEDKPKYSEKPEYVVKNNLNSVILKPLFPKYYANVLYSGWLIIIIHIIIEKTKFKSLKMK
jgi:hypothetical protein